MSKKTFEAAGRTHTGLTVSIKNNQKSLLENIQDDFSFFQVNTAAYAFKEKGVSVNKVYETISCNEENGVLSRHPAWRGHLKTIIKVTRTRYQKMAEIEVQYYVSNRDLTAIEAECVIRTHWLVEGCFHQQLDRCIQEDAQRKSSYSKIIALFNSLLHNLFRRSFPRGEWQRAMRRNASNPSRLLTLDGLFC